MSTIIKELGTFKDLINPILYSSQNIREIILGNSPLSESEQLHGLSHRIFSHLYTDDVMLEAATYIFYDVVIPRVGNTVKTCKLIVYCICHKDIINNFTKQGYYGNRADALAQMVEEVFTDPEIIRQYGIGKLNLTNIDIYRDQRKMYGRILTFEVPTFS